jgi:hypothetical protein
MDERIVKILSTEGFHNHPEDTFRRRVERFPLVAQQEVANRAIDLLFIEGDASDSEQQLMDEARAFVSAQRIEANDIVIWQLGQLIQRRAYDPGPLDDTAVALWNYLTHYSYPKHTVENTRAEHTAPVDSSSSTGRVVRSSSGGWGFIEF